MPLHKGTCQPQNRKRLRSHVAFAMPKFSSGSVYSKNCAITLAETSTKALQLKSPSWRSSLCDLRGLRRFPGTTFDPGSADGRLTKCCLILSSIRVCDIFTDYFCWGPALHCCCLLVAQREAM